MSEMKSRTENVNKNLTFRSDIDGPIISLCLSTIESISIAYKTRIVRILIFACFASNTTE